jgi:hypothetical protein
LELEYIDRGEFQIPSVDEADAVSELPLLAAACHAAEVGGPEQRPIQPPFMPLVFSTLNVPGSPKNCLI